MPHSPLETQGRNCLARLPQHSGRSDSRVSRGTMWSGGERAPGPPQLVSSEESQRDHPPHVTRLRVSEPVNGDAVLRGGLISTL